MLLILERLQSRCLQTFVGYPVFSSELPLEIFEASGCSKECKAPDGLNGRSRGLEQFKLKLFRWSVVRPKDWTV